MKRPHEITPSGALLPTRGTVSFVRDEIAAIVSHWLVNLDRHEAVFERRREQRFSFPVLISLAPANPQGDVLGDGLFAIGKHISASGLGFFHQCSLVQSYYIVRVVHDALSQTGVLWRIRWCRFLGAQWYESGGHFVKIV